MVDIIQDAQGNERRCGSLPMPANRVSSLPPFGGAPNQVLWLDSVIKEVVTDPGREHARELFGDEWILDQLNFGSCNGHALAAAAARARWRRGVRDKLLYSGAFSYAQMKRDGTDPGSVIEDDIENCGDIGMLPLSRGPATKINRRDYTADDYAEAKKHLGLEPYKVVGTFAEKMQALRTALAGPSTAIVAVHAGSKFSKIDSDGVCGVDDGPGNHAVLVDDVYWTGTMWRYDMPNSWNLKFGRRGRGFLTDAHFKQTAGNHEFVILPAIDILG